MPPGERTNNITTGTLSARIIASCPAPLGSSYTEKPAVFTARESAATMVGSQGVAGAFK